MEAPARPEGRRVSEGQAWRGFLLAVFALFLVVREAGAHPYSSNIVGHLLELQLGKEEIELAYRVEVPVLSLLVELRQQLGDRERPDEEDEARFHALKVRELQSGLLLYVDGERVPLELVRGGPDEGLSGPRFYVYTLLLRAALEKDGNERKGEHHLRIEDGNYPDEPAAFAVVVHEGTGCRLLDHLEWRGGEPRWSRDGSMRRIELGWREEGGLEQLAEELAGAARESLGEAGNEEAGGGGGASLLSTGENPLLGFLRGENSGLQLAALLAALLFGAGHALTPGHGKTLVASYLVGSRGTLGQAVVLGLVVTFAHTFSVFVLGTVALLLSDVLAPEALFPWIELASGLLILLIGGALLRERVGAWRSVRVRREAPGFHHAGHWHPPGTPPHEHGPDWTSEGRGRLRWGRLLALGLGGGILPCPSAMVVLLAAIAFHRLLWGMVLVLAFSAGMSAVLVLLGCLVVLLGSRFNRFSPSRELVLLVSIAGACLVLLLGALIAWGGLSRAIEPELPSVPGDAALLLLGGTPSPPVEPA